MKNGNIRLHAKKKTTQEFQEFDNIQTKRFFSEPSVLCHHVGHMFLQWAPPVSMVSNSFCYNRVCLLSGEDGLHPRTRFVHGDMARCLYVLKLRELLGNTLSLHKF